MRRLRERPDKHYRGERCTSRLNSHGSMRRAGPLDSGSDLVRPADQGLHRCVGVNAPIAGIVPHFFNAIDLAVGK